MADLTLTRAGKAFAYREVTAKAASLSPEEFRILQKVIVRLRSNLIYASAQERRGSDEHVPG